MLKLLILSPSIYHTRPSLSNIERQNSFCYNRADAAPLKAVSLRLRREVIIVEIFILLGVTAVGGTIGTVLGGLILDYIRQKLR